MSHYDMVNLWGGFLFREYFISRVVNDERIFHEQAYIKTNMIKDVRGEKYSRPKYQWSRLFL